MLNLAGYPFYPTKDTTTLVNARQVIAFILQKLYSIGWKVIVSCDLARRQTKSSIFLKRFPSDFSSVDPFVCVGLIGTDKLQIINLPSQLIEPLKQVVHQFWTKGIQNESYENGVLKIKMAGNPWLAAETTDQQSVVVKILLQNIVATLYRYQYVYTVNVNLDKSTADSLYFRYDPNVPAGGAPQFCTISLNRTDRLEVVCTPAAIVDMIRGVIQTVWSHGRIQEEKDHHGSWEFKISGNPWHSWNEESIMARYYYLYILNFL